MLFLQLTTVTVAKEFAVLLCEFILYIRSQGKQYGCMGYEGPSVGKTSIQTEQIPGEKVQEIETAKFETGVMNISARKLTSTCDVIFSERH